MAMECGCLTAQKGAGAVRFVGRPEYEKLAPHREPATMVQDGLAGWPDSRCDCGDSLF